MTDTVNDLLPLLFILRFHDQLGQEQIILMCNRYVPPDEAEIERFWHVGRSSPGPFYRNEIFPRSQGPFIRSRNGDRELVVGQWGLIPHFAKSPTLKYNTNNARSEELADKASYRTPWKHGQRCIIPAASFDGSCQEISLIVAEHNPAKQLYEKLGYAKK